ncbi:MAG: DUF72 domain-containing protein [Dehalococcoidia bacterium]|nr:DUF72 domain-containing protein [Dehalococcoidia bacterium]
MTEQQENTSQEQDGTAGPKDRINKGRALIGTQGWIDPDWRRLAYPNGLSASERLSWYARVFDTVEVSSTFYGIPSHATVRTWRGSVPRGFTFTVKMPRLITHGPDLMRSDPELASFLSTVNELGESLGGVLIQLPPWFGPERLQELSQWMSRLPASEFRFFLETRSPALHGSALSESLERAGVGPVTTNLNARPGEIAISPSAHAGYIRWLGPRGSLIASGRNPISTGEDRRPDVETFKQDAALWASAIRSQTERGVDVFGFFSGDYLGTGLLPAAYLSDQLGQAVDLPLRPSATPFMQSALIDAGYPRVDPPSSPRSTPSSDDRTAAQGWFL